MLGSSPSFVPFTSAGKQNSSQLLNYRTLLYKKLLALCALNGNYPRWFYRCDTDGEGPPAVVRICTFPFLLWSLVDEGNEFDQGREEPTPTSYTLKVVVFMVRLITSLVTSRWA